MAWFYAPARRAGDGTHGDAILSRFPLRAPEVKQLPLVDQPINAAQRIAQRSVIELGARTLTLVNVHLDVRLAVVDRIRQLDPAVSDNPHDVLVGGDLNTLPWIWVETAVPLTSTEAIIGQDQAQVVDDFCTTSASRRRSCTTPTRTKACSICGSMRSARGASQCWRRASTTVWPAVTTTPCGSISRCGPTEWP